jgi:hypothetical protein
VRISYVEEAEEPAKTEKETPEQTEKETPDETEVKAHDVRGRIHFGVVEVSTSNNNLLTPFKTLCTQY